MQESLIHAFVRTQNIKQLSTLLEVRPSCINDQNAYKETALHLAIKDGLSDLIVILLEYTPNLSILDGFGLAPMHIAAASNHIIFLQQLLDAKADINVRSGSKATPLISACSKNHSKAVNFLLENGADVNAINDEHKSAIHFVIENKNFELLTVLLSWGANIPQDNDTLEIPEEAHPILLKFKQMRLQKTSSISLLKKYYNGGFPSLKQLTGLFITTSELKNKVNILPVDLQNFIAQYQPKQLQFKPWTSFYKFANSSFSLDESNNKLLDKINELQNLLSRTNCNHVYDIVSSCLSNLELIFDENTDAKEKITRAEKICSEAYEKLQPHLKNSFLPK